VGPVFTEDEQSRIMQYLGYPKQTALEQSYATGYALSNHYTYKYLVDAFNRISADGATRTREALAELQCIDQQLRDMRAQAGVKGAAEVQLDAMEGRRHLKLERADWIRRLCDSLGVEPNPKSQQHGGRVVNT
jgi:hypothetical protein